MGARENLGVLQESATTITEARASTNYIDLAETKPQIGVGQGTPYLCIRTAVAPTGTVDTLSIEVQVDDNSSFTSPRTVFFPFAVGSSDPYTGGGVAEALQTHPRLATAGAWIFRGQLPYEVEERYLRLYFNNTVSAGAFAIDAWLEEGPQSDFGNQVLVSPVGNP
ncbi:MAG: Bbp16 family capsid cement protein [Candidatus Neomarinimicrobiota bacterium]|jgi:hypothetical protein